MIIYDLQCENHHEFEGWFKNTDDFHKQQETGLLTCPACNSGNVSKKVTASKVTRKSNSLGVSNAESPSKPKDMASLGDEKSYQQVQKMLGEMHQYIDSNFTDVGNRFADEALKIHRGEKDAENIRGTASKSELKELAEEGVSALPLPPKPVDKEKLN